MNRNEMTNGDIAATGTVGTAASLGGWFLSHTHLVNDLLQTATLGIGLTIGCVSLYRLLNNNKPKD